MTSWSEKGCEKCRHGILSASWPPPERIAHSDGPIFLHRCGECGSYWELNLREAHVIGEDEARKNFPGALASR